MCLYVDLMVMFDIFSQKKKITSHLNFDLVQVSFSSFCKSGCLSVFLFVNYLKRVKTYFNDV